MFARRCLLVFSVGLALPALLAAAEHRRREDGSEDGIQIPISNHQDQQPLPSEGASPPAGASGNRQPEVPKQKAVDPEPEVGFPVKAASVPEQPAPQIPPPKEKEEKMEPEKARDRWGFLKRIFGRKEEAPVAPSEGSRAVPEEQSRLARSTEAPFDALTDPHIRPHRRNSETRQGFAIVLRRAEEPVAQPSADGSVHNRISLSLIKETNSSGGAAQDAERAAALDVGEARISRRRETLSQDQGFQLVSLQGGVGLRPADIADVSMLGRASARSAEKPSVSGGAASAPVVPNRSAELPETQKPAPEISKFARTVEAPPAAVSPPLAKDLADDRPSSTVPTEATAENATAAVLKVEDLPEHRRESNKKVDAIPEHTEAQGHCDLTLRILDDQGRDVPARIRFSTPAGALHLQGEYAGGIHQDRATSYALPMGELRLEVQAGSDHLPEFAVLKLTRERQSEEVRVQRWADSTKTGWAAFHFYGYLPSAGARPMDLEKLRLTQSAAGVRGLGIETPCQLAGSAGPVVLDYEKLFNLTLDQHGPDRAWFAVQRQLFGEVSLDITSCYRPVQADPSLTDAENFLSMALAAHRRGALVSLMHPAGTLTLLDRRVPAYPLLFFLQGVADVVDLQNEADRVAWCEILRSGQRVTAIRSFRSNLADEALAPGFLVAVPGAPTQRQLLDQVRSGRVLLCSKGALQFTVKSRDQRVFEVGESVPGTGKGLLLTPHMRFALQPLQGHGAARFEVVVNGQARNATRASQSFYAGEALFPEIVFEDGDFLAGRIVLDDGALLETNPVYIGSSWRHEEAEGWVHLRLQLADRRLALVPEARAVLRAPGTYSEKTARAGELEFDAPLDAVITIEVPERPPVTFHVLRRLLERYGSDEVLRGPGPAAGHLMRLREIARNFNEVVQIE